MGLGYTPVQPIKISGQRKGKQNVVQYISTEEMDESEDEKAQPPIKPSVFDRLQPSALRKRPSVLTRIKSDENPKSSVLWRIKNHAQPRPSVFNRIMKAKEPSNPLPQEQKDSVFN